MRSRLALSPGGVRLTLLGTLSLFGLFPPVACAQSATPAAAQGEWQYTLAAGESRAETRVLSTTCTSPHVFVVKSEAKFLRLAQKKVAVTLQHGTGTPLSFTLNAEGLKPGTYAGKVMVECSDCEKDTCKETRNVLPVSLTVVARADTAKDRKTDADLLKAKLDQSLAGVVERFNERVGRLKKIRGPSPDGRIVEGFDATKVASIINDAKGEVIAALEAEELRAARAYVEKYYPLVTNLPTTYVETARASNSPRAEGFRPPPSLSFYAARAASYGVEVVETAAANRAFSNALGFIAMARGEVRPKTLRLITVPDEANVLLEAAGGKKYARGTNSEIGDFWPGIYRITVSKSGYVTISQDNQDIGFSGSVIVMECKLTTSGEAILCRFN